MFVSQSRSHGHGLGAAPQTVVIKKTSGTGQWPFGHTGIGFTKFLELNLTGGQQTNSNRFNDTAPTSTVFSVGTEGDVNASGQTYIAYCFAEKKGFSKFGTYVGNGNANGTFIYTGFKPAFDSDGFSLGSEGGFNSSNTFTSFSWKAANSQGSSNTDGTINSTYTSANTTAGFSIVQYTGTGSNANRS